MSIFNQNKLHEEAILTLKEKINESQEQLSLYINKFLQNEEKWKIINYLIKNINSTLEVNALINLLCLQISSLVNSDICSIFSYNSEKQKLFFKQSEPNEESQELFYMKDFIEKKNIFIGKFINSSLKICSTSIKNYLNENIEPNYYIAPVSDNSSFFGVIFIYKKQECLNAEEINIIQIISENISMALKNARLYEELKKNNNNQIKFIASLTHEFKTPLNTIMGFAEILETENNISQHAIKKYAQNIHNCSKHLYNLIADIQDASIAKSGSIKLQIEKFNTKTLILESISQLEGIMRKKNLQLSTNLFDTIISADPKRFKQIIYNLFSNSTKFSDINGKIKIVSYLENNYFKFEITNYGRIIKTGDKRKLFELFYQENVSCKNNYDGAGIGLALCKKIVELHGGKIDYESNEIDGTTFCFSLPVEQDKYFPVIFDKINATISRISQERNG